MSAEITRNRFGRMFTKRHRNMIKLYRCETTMVPAEGRLSDRLQSAENQRVRLTLFAQVEAKRQILGPSGDIPQIKTALDDVSHRKKTCDIKILTGSGDFHLCTLCKLTKIRRKRSDCKFKILARDSGVFCSQTTGKHSRKAVGKDSPRKTSKT